IEAEEPSPGSRWVRKLAMVLGILLVLLVISYFVVASTAFLKGVILPRTGQSLHADITVQDADISPFSHVTLRKLVVKTTGAEPLITADEVRARYDLLAILRGHIRVHEVTLVSPEVRVVQEPDGQSNLDPLLKKAEKTAPSPAKPPSHLDIQNINLRNGRVLLQKRDKSGSVQSTELANLELSLDRLQNGQSGKASLGAVLRFGEAASPGANGTSNLLEAKAAGSFDFSIDAQLLPKDIKGETHLDFNRTEGVYAELRGLSAALVAEVTPTEIRQLALRFERGGQRLGQLLVSGPFDIGKAQARLKAEVQSIDRQVLNLFSAAQGWDFGTSTLNATSVVDLSRDWKLIVLNGNVNGQQLSLAHKGQSTPPLDLGVEFQTQVNLDDQTAVVQKLNVLGKRNEKELLTASLDRPMNVTWAPRARGFTESNFRLALQQLSLGEWGVLLGTNVPAGQVDLQLNVLAQKDAKQLTTKLSAAIQDLTAQLGSNRLERASVKLDAENVLEDFRMGNLRSFSFKVQQEGKPLASGSGSANYDLSRKQATGQLTAETGMPALLQQVRIPDARASSGNLKLSSAFAYKEDKQEATGAVALSDFTGAYGDYQFEHFQGVLDYSLDLTGQRLQLHRATLSVRRGFENGGSLNLTGKIDLTNRAAQLTFKAVDLNQNALQPFLAPSFGDKRLISLSLNGNGSASYDPSGDSALTGEFNLANWVVQDPQQSLPQTPLSARLQVEGALRQQILDLRQCVLTLSPTARAKNQIQLQARLDLNQTNATPSQINLAAESIDITPYYDLFAGKTNVPKSSSAPPPQDPKQTEPEPVNLPLADLTAGVKIDRFFLREIAVSNLLANVRARKSEVIVDPCKMTLNGAPVDGKIALNLGVPGYTYDLAFQADHVPVEPLANSFSTNRAGYFKGDLIASAQLRGAGVTGVNLRKNLNGQVALNVTNMNLEIVGSKTRRILQPIALVLNLPELLQTPLNWIDARTSLGQGEINLNKFAVLSSAFYAESQGVIPIADVFTNSPVNLPVNLALRRSLAEKARLVPTDAPTNTAYVSLPTFVKLTGTLGDPKSQTDKLVIAGLLARSALKFVPGTEGGAGKVLQGVSDFLTRKGTAPPNVSAPTNAPAGPAQPANPTADLIQGIGALLGGKQRAQPRPTNAPTLTNAAPQSTSKANTNRSNRVSPLDLRQAPPKK
ncbi:MAG: AsmA family protein, partial [Verrucomicrobiales bacterium]|nr:AsmA family protein [Verrucomicrobiales bacterium]